VLRIVRFFLGVTIALIVLSTLVLALSPGARRLAPTWLYYDLAGRRLAQLPAGAEQYVLANGQDFCSVGRDSDCGGYRLVKAHGLAVAPAARQRGAIAAWCVDYVVLRRNTGRLTGSLIYWSNIPRAMVVAQLSSGQYESFAVQSCDLTSLDQ
jgi:hypothetical protein